MLTPTDRVCYNGYGFRHRWYAIGRVHGERPDAVLVVTAAAAAWRYAYEIMAAKPSLPAFCAQEKNIVMTRRRTWGTPSDDELVISLPDLVQRLPAKSRAAPAKPRGRGAAPADLDPETLAAAHPAFHLTSAEKRLLDVIADWRLVSRTHLPGLADASTQRVSQMLTPLTEHGLVTSLTSDKGEDYALTDDGIRYVSNRDRVAPAFGTWSVDTTKQGRMYGRQISTLRDQSAHTKTVQRLMAELAKSAKATPGYYLSELEPPERAILRSNHAANGAKVEPDATGRIRYVSDGGTRWISVVLELERRGITRDRARAKVALYQRFFQSGHKWGEPSDPPLALFVFDTDAQERVFFRVATQMERESESPIGTPFALSNLDQIQATDFLGASWLVPVTGGENRRMHLRRLRADIGSVNSNRTDTL